MTITSSVSRMTLEEQAQAVYDILSDVYERSPWSLEQISRDLVLPSTDYFYVYDQGQVVGFLALQNLVGELEITNIAVVSAYQGRGYAKQLLQQLAERSEPIFLEVRASNQAAQGLYEASGFEAIGRRKNYYQEPLEDAIIMRREGN